MNAAAIKPSRNRLLVQHLANEERTDNGIIIPANAAAHDTHCRSRVISTGSSVSVVCSGNLILTANYKQPDIIDGARRYTFIEEKDILAILNEEAMVRVLPIV